MGGSEHPQSLALGYEVAQCIFTSATSLRIHTKILGHVLQASFIGNHELDLQGLHGLGDISHNVCTEIMNVRTLSIAVNRPQMLNS